MLMLWRYPLKSAAGESLPALLVGPDGPAGDRRWACLSSDGAVVSAKNPRRWGRLLAVRASLQPSATGSTLTVEVPGVEPLVAGSVEADRALSAWLGEPVRLVDTVPASARLQRHWPSQDGMIPDWVTAQAGGTEHTEIAGARPGGRFVDSSPIHLVTEAELDDLSADLGIATDVRPFRPNLVLRLEREPEVGDVLQVGGEVRLRVTLATPRCAIPGAAQPDLPAAPHVLRALGRRRRPVGGYGRAACFGTYAEVLHAGTMSLGDSATLTS